MLSWDDVRQLFSGWAELWHWFRSETWRNLSSWKMLDLWKRYYDKITLLFFLCFIYFYLLLKLVMDYWHPRFKMTFKRYESYEQPAPLPLPIPTPGQHSTAWELGWLWITILHRGERTASNKGPYSGCFGLLSVAGRAPPSCSAQTSDARRIQLRLLIPTPESNRQLDFLCCPYRYQLLWVTLGNNPPGLPLIGSRCSGWPLRMLS